MKRDCEPVEWSWERAFDALGEPALIIDGTDRVLAANEPALRELQVSRTRVPGLSLVEFGREPWRGCRALAHLVRTRGRERERELRETRGGRHWSIHCRHFDDTATAEQNGPLLLVLRESTEFHLMQDAMRRYQKMAWLEKIVSGLAHQVNNPLFAISGSVESLKQQFRDTPEVQLVVDVLEAEVGRLAELMRTFVEFGSVSCTNRSRQQIAPLVAKACVVAGERFETGSLRFVLDIEPEVEALLDRDAFVLAIIKILDNSLELSPVDSKILVSGKRLLGDEGSVPLLGPTFELSVTDQGPGIPAACHQKVFEPFFTRRSRHVGLGLSLAERLVEAHGGTVRCSDSGRGATVVVRVPVLSRPDGGSPA